jgi:hypothetical protein
MSLRSLERIRKRKTEDEEFLFAILPALYFHLTWQRKIDKPYLSFLYGKEQRQLLFEAKTWWELGSRLGEFVQCLKQPVLVSKFED